MQPGGDDMLTVIPKTWSYAFRVMDGTRTVAETVNVSWWRDKAQLSVEGTDYTVRRERSTSFLESAAAGVLARAERPRRWRRELFIEHAGRRFTLRKESLFRRGYLLFEHGVPIGSISPDGIITRKAAAELPQELPLFVRVFIIWLVMTLWKHDDAA
jgi:hypothetical protein